MSDIRTRTVSANGLDFVIDEAGDGDDVALMLHGFPESRQTWRDQMAPLARLGWRVVAPDLRGYGDSSRPKGLEAYRIESLVADVAALFEALGARRRILIGHDWGGVIAWQTALRRAVALDGLIILNAPHPVVFERVLNAGLTQRLRSWYVLFFMLPGLPEWQMAGGGGRGLVRALSGTARHLDPDLLEIFRRNIVRPGAATAMINYYRANATRLTNFDAARVLETPTLMLWGADDFALDIALTRGNEAFVADFTLKLLEGASHWVHLDAPEAISAGIADWARAKGLTGNSP